MPDLSSLNKGSRMWCWNKKERRQNHLWFIIFHRQTRGTLLFSNAPNSEEEESCRSPRQSIIDRNGTTANHCWTCQTNTCCLHWNVSFFVPPMDTEYTWLHLTSENTMAERDLILEIMKTHFGSLVDNLYRRVNGMPNASLIRGSFRRLLSLSTTTGWIACFRPQTQKKRGQTSH